MLAQIAVQIYKCIYQIGSKAQKFKFEPTQTQAIDNGVYEIQTQLDSNKVIDISGGSIENSANVQLWERANVNQQKFILLYDASNKDYTIQAAHSGKVLDVAGGGTTNGTNVQQYENNGSIAQKWKIIDLADGTYNIISECGELSLDIDSGKTASGTNVQIYEKNGSNAQLFKFIPTSIISVSESNFVGLDENKYPGYKTLLSKLQSDYPNWSLKIVYTGLDWNTVINEEDQVLSGIPRSLIYETYGNEWINGTAKYDVSLQWYRASQKAIAYMMDPRNSIDNKWFFQFQDLSSSSGTYDEISKMTENTFLHTDSLIKTIINTAQTHGISPFHLVSRIIQEQGKDGSGAMNGYEYLGTKVYNLFNINVSGNTSVGLLAGARYAYSNSWFSQEASIAGGAEFLKTEYLNKGQSSLYFQKFNVVNENNLYGNQYMQNIRAANDEGNTIYSAYLNNGILNSHFEFVIPVYENMPQSACSRPSN